MKNHSYNIDNKDPKVLYEAVYRTLIKMSSNSVTTFIRKLINIDINKFESLQKYLDRVLFIDDKLTRSNIKMPKELISTILLKDMKKLYERKASHLNITLDLDQIEYQILKERL